jgi:hypothetical protein
VQLHSIEAPSYGFQGGSGPYYMGAAMFTQGLAGSPCVFLYNANLAVQIVLQGNGSIVVGTPAETTPQSAPNLVQTGVYAYFELSVALSGSKVTVEARINGFTVIGPVAIDASGVPFYNGIYMFGPGGGLNAWVDDLYLCDGSGAYTNTFLGPVRIYTGTPIADSSPLQWTPSSGSPHYSLVNQIPPSAGATYVSSETVGQIDQYLHANGSPPAGGKVLAVQHCLDANIATAGSRALSSCIDGTSHGASALTTTYHIYTQPYDVNPVTGLPWDVADFATLPIGPEVTA